MSDLSGRDSDLVAWLGDLACRLAPAQLDAVEAAWFTWARESLPPSEGEEQCLDALENAGVPREWIVEHLG